jgi:hypothetical protein
MTERERAMARGMIAEEAECWELTVSVARHWFALPNLHESDDPEVVQAIHVIQNKLLSRPTYRQYLELDQGA